MDEMFVLENQLEAFHLSHVSKHNVSPVVHVSSKPIRHKRREENQEPKGQDWDPASLSSCLFPHRLR